MFVGSKEEKPKKEPKEPKEPKEKQSFWGKEVTRTNSFFANK